MCSKRGDFLRTRHTQRNTTKHQIEPNVCSYSISFRLVVIPMPLPYGTLAMKTIDKTYRETFCTTTRTSNTTSPFIQSSTVSSLVSRLSLPLSHLLSGSGGGTLLLMGAKVRPLKCEKQLRSCDFEAALLTKERGTRYNGTTLDRVKRRAKTFAEKLHLPTGPIPTRLAPQVTGSSSHSFSQPQSSNG